SLASSACRPPRTRPAFKERRPTSESPHKVIARRGAVTGSIVPRESTMKTQLATALAVCLLFGAGAARADEQAEAKALLDRATKAMNGEGKLVKYGTGTLKGKLTVPEGGGDVIVTVDGTWHGMSKYRVDADLQEGGRNFKALLVVNG